jgi:hypothetical protein
MFFCNNIWWQGGDLCTPFKGGDLVNDVFEAGGWVTLSPVEKIQKETKSEIKAVIEKTKEEDEDQVQDSDE